jgi:hypothetical protein
MSFRQNNLPLRSARIIDRRAQLALDATPEFLSYFPKILSDAFDSGDHNRHWYKLWLPQQTNEGHEPFFGASEAG